MENTNLNITSPEQPIKTPTPVHEQRVKYHTITAILLVSLIILGVAGYFLSANTKVSKQINLQQKANVTNFKDEDYIKAGKEAKVYLQKSLSLVGAQYVTIPGTELEIQVPASYAPQPIEKDTMLDATILLNFKNDLPVALQPLLNHPGGWWGDFKVGEIQTTMTPKDWVLENVTNQGIKLKDEPTSVSRGSTVTINGNQFFVLNVGCCAADYFVYFLPYTHVNGQKSILVFATHNSIGAEDSTRQRNIILDTIVTTIREKVNYFTVDQWQVRLAADSELSGLLPGNIVNSAYSSTDQSLIILAPQLDANWTCAADPDGSKATLGSISRTTDTKRAGPSESLVTKKIGNYTYGFEAKATTNCTKDPTYQILVEKFKTVFNSLESY